MPNSFVHRMSADTAKRHHATRVNEMKKQYFEQTGRRMRMVADAAPTSSSTASGPKMVMHKSTKNTENKDHEWGALGW